MSAMVHVVACAMLFAAVRFSNASDLAATNISFRNDVAPILLQHCQECHGPKKAKGKFRLDTFERLMKSGDADKRPIIPDKTAESELYRLITTADEDDRMPQKADPLPREKIETIRKWIEQGARFDGENAST